MSCSVMLKPVMFEINLGIFLQIKQFTLRLFAVLSKNNWLMICKHKNLCDAVRPFYCGMEEAY